MKTKLSDKYLVRGWISDKIGDKYLIPLLGVYEKFEDIDFKKLPNKFVIKCNHGKKYNIIVRNKSHLNITDVKLKVEKWIKENYAFINGLELQYKDINPKIIIEKYMDDGTGDLTEYKFVCFNGQPYFLHVDSNIHSYHTQNIFDFNWDEIPYKLNSHIPKLPSLEKPKCLMKMVKLASILSKNFIYVRVGFYVIFGKIYFGEMDFSSSSGTEDITPKCFERYLSSLIKLPKLVYNIDTGEYYELKKYFSIYPFYMILIFLSLKLLYNLFKLIKLIKLYNI